MIRKCLECKSDKTYTDKRGYEYWRKYKNGYACKKCFDRLVDSPKLHKKLGKIHNDKYNPKHSKNRLVFKNKRILLDKNPRTGQCSKCKRKVGEGIKRTSMHHIKYHDDDPLRDTIELCTRCHNKAHHRRYFLYKNKPGGYLRFYKRKNKKKR